MNEDRPSEELPLGEKLLGIEGFSAARARRYRAEMEKLVVHRISTRDRWIMGGQAALCGTSLIIMGLAAMLSTRSAFAGFDEAGLTQIRLTAAATCFASGLLFGGWLLAIAVRGGYARRLGDVIGLAIALVFGGGWAATLVEMALGTENPTLRADLFIVAGALVAVLAGALLTSLLRRMHRQTQEKLLRIEYHLAEIMERQAQEHDRAAGS